MERIKESFREALNGRNIQIAISNLDEILKEMDRAVSLYTKSIDRQKQR